MLPCCLIYFLVMDIVFIIYTVLNDVFGVLFCRSTQSDQLDGFFTWLGMSNMDVKGYRKLRTLSQLTFESIPQLLMQIVFVIFYRKEAADKGVNMKEIGLSLAFAGAHFLSEVLLLYVESRAVKQTMYQPHKSPQILCTMRFHYILECLSGRFGWVPFVTTHIDV